MFQHRDPVVWLNGKVTGVCGGISVKGRGDGEHWRRVRSVSRWRGNRVSNGIIVWSHLFLVEVEVGHRADGGWRWIRVCREEYGGVERSLAREHREDRGKLLRRDNRSVGQVLELLEMIKSVPATGWFM